MTVTTFAQENVAGFVSSRRLFSLVLMGLRGDVGGEVVDNEGRLLPDTKRRRTSLDSMKIVMAAQYIQHHLPKIEPFLRRVVQEEVQNAIWRGVHLTPRIPLNNIEVVVSNRYRLLFRNSLPRTLFTSSKIEAENQKPVEIVLVDSNTKQIITCGSLSSLKVEILALDGDFGVDGQDEWTEKEFSDCIVREREGKRPLLSGELIVTLNKGVGYLGDANFTDNSSWTRSRRFRLGARISQCRIKDKIQEAVSGAFLVKDHRGELYKKHHPPSLTDDVWRLEKIGKDGVFHKRLADSGVITVQDFLKNFVMDPDKLRMILGNGMSNKMWEATVEHAKKCVISPEKLYSYNCGQGLVLLFNAINELLGAIIQNKIYCLNELPANQKVLINKLKQDAYRSQGLITEIIHPMVGNCPSILPSPTESVTFSNIRCLDGHIPSSPLTYQGNGELDNLCRMKNTFTGMASHQGQASGSFQSTNNTRYCYDMPLHNSETSGFAEPITVDDRLMSFNAEPDMLFSSQFPMLLEQPNGLLQVSNGRRSLLCFRRVPHVGAPSMSSKWAKLKAVSKWMGIARRSSRRSAFMNSADPLVTSSMPDHTFGGFW